MPRTVRADEHPLAVLRGRRKHQWRTNEGHEEHGTGRRPELSAAVSLAAAAAVKVEVARRALENGRARVLIQSRGRAPPRRSSRSGLSPVEALYILQEKWEPTP